jgi:LysR family transcriptional regulator, transcriptional activator for dmlA
MSLDFFSCLKGFVAVAEYNGFSQAARYLRVSTPLLTNQIKRLEDLLGKKLLHRTTRHVSRTEAGEIYLLRAKKILAEIQDAKNEICHLEEKPHGMLTVGVPASFNTLFFVKHLKKFLDKYPKIQLNMIEENSPLALLKGEADLIVSEMDVKDKQLIKEHLFTIHRHIYAAPKYIKTHGVPETIADLKKHNCLIAQRVSPNNEWILANNRKVAVTGNYSSTSGINILYAGLEGMGLIWSADIAIKEEINAGKLIEIRLKDKPTAIKIYLYHRPVHRGSNIQLMAEHLQQITLSSLLLKHQE